MTTSTSRITGVRNWTCVALLAAAACLGGVRAAEAATEFPVASLGDIWFQADQAGFMDDDGSPYEEYYFRVSNSQLEFTEADEGWYEGRVFVKLTFRDAEGDKVGEASHRYEFTVPDQPTALSPDHAQILVLREALDPRTAIVDLEMEDLNARKRGLLYFITGKRQNGTAVGLIDPPPFLSDSLGISDVQFAWQVEPAKDESPFVKHDMNVIPNPSRSYGLLQPRLAAYYEVYDRHQSEEATTYLIQYDMMNPAGEVVRSHPDTVVSDSGAWAKVVTFDLTRMGSGEYRLRTTVTRPDAGISGVSERPFSLIWRTDSWERTERDILDEARVLFTENEYERFKTMSAGDRELYIEQFWADADPSPGSATNELRNEFMRRVAFANRHYSTSRRGMLTDRGRIYIRFGEPDEVERQLIPTRGDQLDQLVGDLTRENARGRMLASNDEIDTRPYEVWTYTQQGHPLFPEREFTTSVTGLRFVFVDETGTGHYVLRYASDFIGF